MLMVMMTPVQATCTLTSCEHHRLWQSPVALLQTSSVNSWHLALARWSPVSSRYTKTLGINLNLTITRQVTKALGSGSSLTRVISLELTVLQACLGFGKILIGTTRGKCTFRVVVTLRLVACMWPSMAVGAMPMALHIYQSTMHLLQTTI